MAFQTAAWSLALDEQNRRAEIPGETGDGIGAGGYLPGETGDYLEDEGYQPGETGDAPNRSREPDAETLARREARHREAANLRERIRDRLYLERREDLGNKLAHCGLPVPLTCVCCGEGRVVESRCKRRWCPACSYSIQCKRVERFAGAVKLMQWPLFITLTQPNSADPETVRALRAAWGRMRRRRLIMDRISGGIASIEVTNTGNGWHPHLHALVDCQWLSIHTPPPNSWESAEVVRQKCDHAREELSAIWGSVINSATAIVLAARVRDDRAAMYLLKYATKGSELLESPEPIGPLIDVLDRSRLISAFGNLHGRTQEMDGGEQPGFACIGCGAEKTYIPNAVLHHHRAGIERGNIVPVHFGSDFRAKVNRKNS